MAFIKKVEEVTGSPFKNFKFENVGDTLTFLFTEIADATSPEYGEFEVLRGLKFNPEVNSLDEALATAELVSFPMQTQIANKINSGAMRPGEAYQIKLIYKKGDTYETATGKKAKCKSNGYEVLHLILDDEVKEALKAKYYELAGKDTGLVKAQVAVKDEEAEQPTQLKRTPKL